MYISNREMKRRAQKLQHMSKEELMVRYYAKQQQSAFTVRTPEDRRIFEDCKGKPIRKRVHNTCYREEAGTCGTTIYTKRFATSQTFVEKRGSNVRKYTLTSYTNVTCKGISKY